MNKQADKGEKGIMSIYPVSIKEWYKEPYEKGDMSGFGSEWELLKGLLPHLKCNVCGKKVGWRYGHVTHSMTFGCGEGWCSKKCLKIYKKPKKN